MRYIMSFLAMLSVCPVLAQDTTSTLVMDVDRQVVIVGRNTNSIRSIASLTKIMTAMVTLAWDSDLDRRIPVTEGSKMGPGRHTRRDVISAMLIRSDNGAADALARDYPGGIRAFVQAMNRRARLLDLPHTRFQDASGLDAGNISTAGEVAQLMIESLNYPLIRETSVQRQMLFEHNLGQKVRRISLDNTNQPLLLEFDSIIASKTGYTRVAGWCVGLVAMQGAQRTVVVILGADTKHHRLAIARELLYNHLRDSEVDRILARDSAQTKAAPMTVETTPWWRRFWTWLRS